MQQIPIPATLPVSITLEAQQWNLVIMAMGKAPYEVVAALIQTLTDQVHQAAMTAGANGLDKTANDGAFPS
jgi:hypothetical protein